MKKRIISIMLILAMVLPTVANAVSHTENYSFLPATYDIYIYLENEVQKVASGERSSTKFTLPGSYTWKYSELGCGSNPSVDVLDELLFREISTTIDVVICECPSIAFWYDVEQGFLYTYNYYFSGSEGYITVSDLTFEMYVTEDCAAEGTKGTTTVSERAVEKAARAHANAEKIVSEAASFTDYGKLRYYLEQLCILTEYDDEYKSLPYGDNHQFTNVLDGDPGTLAVCEGYAKAFRILCELSTFSHDLQCYTILGNMNGEAHMWNIVSMEDGKNYLVDVTNCDGWIEVEENGDWAYNCSTGYPDRLFLTGAEIGNVELGYTVRVGPYEYIHTIKNGAPIKITLEDRQILYTYNDFFLRECDRRVLTIASQDYTPPAADMDNAVIALTETDFVYDGKQKTPEVTVTLDGETLVEDTDYTIAYGENTLVGTGTVTITGIGDYTGSRTVEFSIEPQVFTAKADMKDGTAKVTVSSTFCNDLVKQAEKSGSKKETIVVTAEDMVKAAEVTVPVSLLKNLVQKSEASLQIKTLVGNVLLPHDMMEAFKHSGSNLVLYIERVDEGAKLELRVGNKALEDFSGNVTLSIPTEKCTAGTVAMMVSEDGTQTLLPFSLPDTSEGVVHVSMSGSGTVTLVDRGKDFSDVKTTNWGYPAQQFVTSRQIFNGTSADTFSPSNNMTIAMFITVLARLDGVDTTGGDTWYSVANDWTIERGIHDGTDLQSNITREQMALMMWRYFGSPESDADLSSFTDAGNLSEDAVTAMRWAVENGVFSGKGNGILDPGGLSTRLEVAQVIKNCIKYAVGQ